MTRILVADAHEVVRWGLQRVLHARPDFEVVAEATDGKQAILKAILAKPDVAVIEYSLPLINGLEVTRRLRRRLPRTEILIFTTELSETLVFACLRAGARGYLLKSDANHHLLDAVSALATHRPYFTDDVSQMLLISFLARPRRSPEKPAHRQPPEPLTAQLNQNQTIADNLDNLQIGHNSRPINPTPIPR
jgi:DNA-binding NarL/FixJ family response regulator